MRNAHVIYSQAKQSQSAGAKTAASSTATTPSEVDLSHLTSQELEVIQKVMEKELTFETQEQQRAKYVVVINLLFDFMGFSVKNTFRT